MNYSLVRILFSLFALNGVLFFHAGAQSAASSPSGYQPPPYVPDSKELYDSIVQMDSLYFDTYNHCNLEKMSTLMSDDIEFYHDRGGLSTSKSEILEGIQKNICGKVTRELARGSIEVYPIHDYGAVEIGYHHFHNNAEPDAPAKDSKFIVIWQHKDGAWKMTRVISLH